MTNYAPAPGHRVRLARTKGWRMPAGAVKVDRTTLYGNPFIVGQPNGLGWGEVRDPAHAVWLFRQWLTTPTRSIAYEADRHRTLLQHLPALAGKDLACWCTAGSPCHADVLLELAARPDITEVCALLQAWTAPPSPLEITVVAGQLGRALDLTPDELSKTAPTITALATLLEQHRGRP